MPQYLVNSKVDLKDHPGFKWNDLVRQVFPNATDDTCDYMLWEHTGFPSFWSTDDHIACCLGQLEEAKAMLNGWDGDPDATVDFQPLYDKYWTMNASEDEKQEADEADRKESEKEKQK